MNQCNYITKEIRQALSLVCPASHCIYSLFACSHLNYFSRCIHSRRIKSVSRQLDLVRMNEGHKWMHAIQIGCSGIDKCYNAMYVFWKNNKINAGRRVLESCTVYDYGNNNNNKKTNIYVDAVSWSQLSYVEISCCFRRQLHRSTPINYVAKRKYNIFIFKQETDFNSIMINIIT